jgi:hypothetical protein
MEELGQNQLSTALQSGLHVGNRSIDRLAPASCTGLDGRELAV